MNKEYEIYYEAFDIEDSAKQNQFILEKCADDKNLYDNIMRLFPEEQIDDDRYGKYEIKKKIGKGGMGIVYFAVYTETFGTESFTKKSLSKPSIRTQIRT